MWFYVFCMRLLYTLSFYVFVCVRIFVFQAAAGATGRAAAGSSGHSGHAPKLMKNAQHFPLLNTLHKIQKITVYLGKSRARGDRLDRLHLN